MQYPPLLSNCEKYAIMSAGENIWRQGGIKGIMAKIAFCDDDVSVLAEMQRLMEQYCAERDCKIEYHTMQTMGVSPREISSAGKRGTPQINR